MHIHPLNEPKYAQTTAGAETIANYRPLPGQPLSAMLGSAEAGPALLYRVGGFIARGHRSDATLQRSEIRGVKQCWHRR
jgi:hypothetical protein